MPTKRYARCPQWCQVSTKIPDAQKRKAGSWSRCWCSPK